MMAIIGFVAVVIGATFLGSIANTNEPMVSPTSVNNESFSGVNNTYVALSNDDFTSVSAVRNSTGHSLTVTTDYDVNLSAGEIRIKTGSGTYYADYAYKGSSYINESGTRSIVNLIELLFALIVLAAILAAVWPQLRDKMGF